MSMGDEVVGVTLQVTEKAVSAATHTAMSILDLIGKLLKDLLELSRQQKIGGNQVKSSSLTGIKSGKVGMQELQLSARANGDTMSFSENALTKEDMKRISKKAKAFGIPVK